MKRLLWLGVGIAVGVVVVRAISKRAQLFTPGGIAGSVQESAAGFVETVRNFVDDVRDGMAEREEEIQAAFTEGLLIDDLEAEKEGNEYR